MVYLSVMGLLGKRLVKNRRAATTLVLALVCAVLIAHTALTLFTYSRENYLAACLAASDTFPNATVAGWVGGLIVYSVSAVMSAYSSCDTLITFSVSARIRIFAVLNSRM